MEYRPLGRTGLQVSAIGLGTEHLGQDRENLERVLRLAVDSGVNYIDLFFWEQLGSALAPYRDRFILAAHCEGLEDILAHAGNDYVEIGMLTMVDTETKWRGEAQQVLDQLQRYKQAGRIGAVGLSSHRAPIAIQAIQSGRIDVLMYPVNLASQAIAADHGVYQACVDHGVGLVAMKPYAGGTLLVTKGRPSGITPVQCLAYTLALPVATAVTGVKDAAELQAALRYGETTAAEKDYGPVLADLSRYLGDRNIYLGQCVYCNHCLSCPQDIAIGEVIRIVNLVEAAGMAEARAEYANLAVKASECTACGVCVKLCPFDVDIVAKMRQAVELFEGKIGGGDRT
jgi:predicted aldo/keto reductase-like oxidoreductase